MEYAKKGIVLLAVIFYMLIPDVAPGPVDDIIVMLCGMAAQKKIG